LEAQPQIVNVKNKKDKYSSIAANQLENAFHLNCEDARKMDKLN